MVMPAENRVEWNSMEDESSEFLEEEVEDGEEGEAGVLVASFSAASACV